MKEFREAPPRSRLPGKDDLGVAYFDLRSRIDEIVSQAQKQGSLHIALSGSIRSGKPLTACPGSPASTARAPRSMSRCRPMSLSTSERSPSASSKSSTTNRKSRRGSRKPYWRLIMSQLCELAYQIDPALWVGQVLGITPAPWQEQFLRAPHGRWIIALTARQVGKTTTATWAIPRHMPFTPAV